MLLVDPEEFSGPDALSGVDNRPTVRAHRLVQLHSKRGKTDTFYYPCREGRKAVIVVGGIGPRQESPAGQLFPQILDEIRHRHMGGMRLKFRDVANVNEGIFDLRLGIQFLLTEGFHDFAVVAHGAAAIPSLHAIMSVEQVSAVALLSAAPLNLEGMDWKPRGRMLVIHGGRDEKTTVFTAKAFYDSVTIPKEFVLLPRSTHSLHENSVEVHLRLRRWLADWGGLTQ